MSRPRNKRRPLDRCPGCSLRRSEANRRRRLDMPEYEEDAPDHGGRDVDLLAARGELNLRTWLDD